MNSTYYSVENQDYDYEDFDLPILESETLRNLNFPHSLQAVQKAMTKISNKECINDTASILLAISKREKWALECKFKLI